MAAEPQNELLKTNSLLNRLNKGNKLLIVPFLLSINLWSFLTVIIDSYIGVSRL